MALTLSSFSFLNYAFLGRVDYSLPLFLILGSISEWNSKRFNPLGFAKALH